MRCSSSKRRGGICNIPSAGLAFIENMSEDEKYHAIIADYKANRGDNNDYLNSIKSIDDAIKIAALATDSEGKRLPHQYRISKKHLMAFCDSLLMYREDIDHAKSFEDLYAIVEKARVYGIGELAIYDTAQRIGVYMGLHPNYVYMHAGTRSGAKKLIGKKSTMRIVDKSVFPEEFRKLSCAEIEDILCMYKVYL